MRVERIRDEATLGLDAAFVRSVRRDIDEQIREPAERLYGSGASRDAVREDLKAVEQLVVYHDYEACCVSVLGRLAAEGQTWAWPLIERIVDNTRRCLAAHAGEDGSFFPIRRLPLHLARCYRFLGLSGGGRRDRLLRETIEAAAGAVIEHFGRFHPGLSELCNQTLGTGVNHVAIAAEGVWLAGEVLNRREWQRMAEDFADRLLAYGHRDGYFEENTNDRREGGPSLCYTTLTAGALYHLCRWRGELPIGRFQDCGRFSRMVTDAGLNDLLFADERTNREQVSVFGLALHSLSGPGRGFLRLLLADRVRPIGTRVLEAMARLDHELDGVELGGGAVPEPWVDGSFGLSLPLGVHRGDGWTLGLSALRALNREIQAGSDYALDRQALVYASHQDAGALVAGFKSKRDARFSTLCAGDDAYPASTGELAMTSDAMTARVRYESFEATLCWQFGDEPTLVMTSEHEGTLVARLPLELLHGRRLIVNGDRSMVLGDDELEISDVRRVDADAWSVACSHAGGLRWPISPFNPYTQGNVSPRESWRLLWAVPWRGRCEFRFSARTGKGVVGASTEGGL